MGPLLWRENYTLYYPGDPNKAVVPNYYTSEYKGADKDKNLVDSNSDELKKEGSNSYSADDENNQQGEADNITAVDKGAGRAREDDLAAVDKLPWAHPRRIWASIRLVFLYGITKDVIGHQSRGLEDVHSRAPQFDNKVEHLWTTAQVCSAIIMSIAHGANDVSNAIGPFTTEYETWSSGVVSAETDTPTWIKAVGGLTLGVGFWTFGYHIMRNLVRVRNSFIPPG